MPFDRSRYPKDWEEIVQAVRARSGNHCEGSPRYPGCRAANGRPHPSTGRRVVLTTAHLNHDVTDNQMTNLRHLCNRCHLTHDAAFHAANAKATRARKLSQGQRRLFD